MRQNEFWSRVFTFVPTATKNDGEEIDEKRFLQAIDFQIDNGVDGICIFGSTGGNGSFTDEEMKTATTIAAKHINGRVPLVAGTGARTTTACIALCRHAEHVGCDGVMVLPVSYWPLTPDEVFDHYERVSRAIKIPICVYNNPWTTGVDMKPEFLAKLAKLDNVSCIKESTGDLTRITAIRLLTKDQVTLIAGWESSSLQAFMAGASGWAPVCTNFVPGDAMRFFPPRCKSAMRRRRRPSGTSCFQFAISSARSLTFAWRIRVSTFSGVPLVLPAVRCACSTPKIARSSSPCWTMSAQKTVDVG